MRLFMRVPSALFSVAGLTLWGTSGAVRAADVTVVSETTITGLPDAVTNAATAQGGGDVDLSKPVETTLFVKNNKHRTESAKTVVIVDGGSGTTYTLDTAQKTYTVVKGSPGVLPADLAETNPFLDMIKMDVQTAVNPGGQTQTIAGQTTKNYRFRAVFKMSIAGGANAAAANAMPAGGPSLAQVLPTIVLQGEEWTAEGLLPETAKNMGITSSLANMAPMMPFLGGGMKDFMAKMAAIKGFPLASTISTTIKFSEAASASIGGMGGMLPKNPIVITTRAKSVSTAPLDDALFAPPADYKKVEVPAAPVSPTLPPAT